MRNFFFTYLIVVGQGIPHATRNALQHEFVTPSTYAKMNEGFQEPYAGNGGLRVTNTYMLETNVLIAQHMT